ncbi:MAG: DNA polymerase III subunit delta [Pseudomonadota bacterium]|nr:DNA polymerase III subunit delta [Pseudomonadota bacterium]
MAPGDRLLSSLSGKTFFISGDEPLQINEFCDSLRSRAIESGILERLVFEIVSADGWSAIDIEINSLSLFASSRLIEVHLNGKIGKDGENILKKIVGRSNSDVYLIKAGELDSKTKKTSWYTILCKETVTISYEYPSNGKLPDWISDRFASLGKKVSREAANLIADRTEGNLIATAQEIEKLSLLIDTENVTLDKVVESVLNGAKFGIYDYRDSLLRGSTRKSLQIVRVLKDAGVEPLILNWVIRREFRDLFQVALRREAGENLNNVLKSLRIWGARSDLVKIALRRGGFRLWLELLLEVANIGLMIKGAYEGDPWESLDLLTIKACEGFAR